MGFAKLLLPVKTQDSMHLWCRVVHLDLKSSNVLLAADGTAKISDVGLSAQMDHSHISSMPVAGTWAWVAPEVILGGMPRQRCILCIVVLTAYNAGTIFSSSALSLDTPKLTSASLSSPS